jgi:PTS system trehalose-specific IIC component
MIGSAIGGVLLTMNNVQATSIGVGGVPGFLSIFPDKWGVFFIGMAIVLVVPFLLTVVFGRAKLRKEDRLEANGESAEIQSQKAASTDAKSKDMSAASSTNPKSSASRVNILEVMAPLTGEAVPLEQVPDPAFAEKQMGEGIAIEPSGNQVVAPFDAQVAHVIKSKHAVILEHASGLQVLIHVGINTVSLKGEGFSMFVNTGDRVRAGQKLLEFDRKVIEDAGFPVITPVIIPDGQEMVERVEVMTGEVTSNRNGVLKIHLKG